MIITDRLKYKLQCFMAGRYGPDELYRFLFLLYAILLVLNCFIHSAGISIALWILLFYTLYRMMSKNISARQKENAKYLLIKNKLTKDIKSTIDRFKDKEHVYRRCPHCKAMLRFPRKKGKHNAVCPKCKKDLKVNVWF